MPTEDQHVARAEEIAMVECPVDPAALSSIRELDRRVSDTLHVTLLWNARTNAVFVSLVDEREGVSVQFEVASAHALEAFRDPYAYANAEPESQDGALAA